MPGLAHDPTPGTDEPRSESRRARCSSLQHIDVAMDIGLPLIRTGDRDRCDVSGDRSSATATVLAVAGWVLQLLAWAFAALFVAGFTSAVRRT